MPALQVHFLGPLEIRHGDQPLPKPPTVKSQSLLAYLICHRRQPTRRERLAELFWGDRPDRRARHSLATALWQIRRCLSAGEPGLSHAEGPGLSHAEGPGLSRVQGPGLGTAGGHILSDTHTVQFDPQSELWLDAEAFESLVAHHEVPALEAAVALFRGAFLDGFYDDWIINERYRLETLFHAALARLMAGQYANGDVGAALSTALRLLQYDPLREDAHRLAMRAYCHLGQRNEALEQYGRCLELVQADLSVEPSAETTELYEAILEGSLPVGRRPQLARSRPVAAEVRAPSGRSPLDALASTRLVGRQREVELLQEAWQRAGAGQGGLVLLSGEAGVGKTRLAEEFAGRLGWQGTRVLWGRCYEFERDLPYQPISEALRAILPTLEDAELADLDPGTAAEVAHLAPEVVDHCPGLEVAAPADPSQEQARLIRGVAGFFRHLCSRGALLFVIEDLHWASESTLQMFHYLARHLTSHPVLLLATLREEAVGRRHPLRRLQRHLHRQGLAHLHRLPRLPLEAVQEMVVEISGLGQAAVPLARRLYQETEGNPFFLMEIVKALFEAELLRLEGGTWRGDLIRLSEGQLPVPANLSEAVQARVDNLDGAAQEALRLAAVLGREFDFDLLNAAWGRGEEATLGALDTLLRRRLLEEGSGAMGRDYAFTHHKIQEVVYGGLPRHRRQHTHAQVGHAMERLYGSAERELLAGELAHHFEQGMALDRTLTGKATTYLLRAGDRARCLYAHHEAIDYYRRALGLFEKQGEREQAARTLMRLGLTYHSAFDYRQARQAYERGFFLWQHAMDGQPSIPTPATQSLRLSWHEPTTLDPARSDTQYAKVLTDQLFSGLVELSPNMEVLPDVAHRWEVLDGGCTYIFHLRRDVVWSDGAPVTSHDFEYAWRRALDPATGSLAAGLLSDIRGAHSCHQCRGSDPDRVGVHALDERTLKVELAAPAGYFLYVLANCANWPAPRHTIQQLGEAWLQADNLVSNGPFQLAAWQPGVSMTLARNPRYHGHFEGNIHRVELCLLPDTEILAAMEMYEAGELDSLTLWRPPPAETDPARQAHPGEYLRVPKLSTYFVVFDSRRPPFDDVRVRQAFVLATDRETLASVVLRGYESPATGGFVPPGMPGFSPGIGLPFDPDRARELLAEAGFGKGRGFPIVEAVAARSRLSCTTHLQAAWRELLGVDVRWDVLDGMPEDRLLNEPPAILAFGWLADYPDPDSFLRTSSVPWCTGWRSEACEGLVDEARRATDQAQRLRLYGQAERILIEEARIMPLTHGTSHLLVKPWVRRYPISSIGTHSWKDVIIEPR